MFCDNADEQVGSFNELLLALQKHWVAHSPHITKPSDQLWFGTECRSASDAK